jgi:hypothetical protein
VTLRALGDAEPGPAIATLRWGPVFATTNRGLTLWKVFARSGVRAQRDLVIKIASACESKGGEVNRGIIGVIIGVLVIIILVIVILQLT